MIRARFYSSAYDYRPMKWPIKYPYWCIGETAEFLSILIAYADSLEEIYEMWPEAEEVEWEEVDEIIFTSRFPKPDWYKEEEK